MLTILFFYWMVDFTEKWNECIKLRRISSGIPRMWLTSNGYVIQLSQTEELGKEAKGKREHKLLTLCSTACFLSCERIITKLDLCKKLYLLPKTVLELQVLKNCWELWLLTTLKSMCNAAHLASRAWVYKLNTWKYINVFLKC